MISKWMSFSMLALFAASCAGPRFQSPPRVVVGPGAANLATATPWSLTSPPTTRMRMATSDGVLSEPVGGALSEPVDGVLSEPVEVSDVEYDAAGLDSPCVVAEATVAFGAYTHRTSGSTLDDKQVATLARLRFEFLAGAGIGLGAAVEGMSSDDDLFENDGFVAQEASMGDAFVYVLFQPCPDRRIRLPIRVGPYLRGLAIEDASGPDEVVWSSFGVRVEIEPEVVLVSDENAEVSVFTGLGIGVHGTIVEVESTTPAIDDRFESDGTTVNFEAGLRGRVLSLAWALSYIYRGVRFDESDPELGLFVRETNADFQGVAFTLGIRF